MYAVSAVIITKNESANIERVCKSLQWCDEILVVDSGSSDDTVAKAEALGARVLVREFDGYGTQKAYAVSEAKNRWILSVDADEEVLPDLKESILALPEEDRMSGYYITRIDKFNGKLLKHTLGSHRKILRFFDSERGNFNIKTIHGTVEIEGRTGILNGFLCHYSYESLSAYFEKFNRYTTMQAELYYEQGKRATPFKTMVRFPLGAFDALIFKGGILDGFEGFVMGTFHALYSMVKYAKLLEIQKRKGA